MASIFLSPHTNYSDAEISPKLCTIIKSAVDTLIIYYAGHGVIGKAQKLYLATFHTIHAMPEYSNALSFDKLWKMATDKKLSRVKQIIFEFPGVSDPPLVRQLRLLQ